MKALTVAFMDCATGEILFRTTRKALGKRALSKQALFRINGKFWRVANLVQWRWPYLRVDVEEVELQQLLARPWCTDGVWSPPPRRPGE